MKGASAIAFCFIFFFPCIGICHARATIESLAQVEKLFMEGKHERVVWEADKLIDARAYGREELFYLKGLSQIQLAAFKVSRQTFNYMIERYPRGKRAFDGYIAIGDSYFIEGKFNEAIKGYEDGLGNYPENKNSSIAYYKIASSYQKLGMGEKAKEYFDKVKKNSPLSFESKMIPKDLNIKEVMQSPETAAYYVQVGYFRSRDNAKKLSEKLRQKGYDGNVSIVMKTGNTFYRVKVGNFKSKIDAEIMAKKLKADGYKTKVCR